LRRDRADLEHARLLDAVVRPAGRRSRHGRRTRAEHERRRAVHYKRIVDDGAIYSQPFSEGGAAAAGGVAFGTEAKPVKGGWIVNGKKIFASLSGHADYYGVLCTEIAEGEKASRRNTLYLAAGQPPTAYPSSATGIRWACAAPYRARCCSRMCSCRRMRR
jgi:alkylation response protein AidB-like acyl-CoA dehydrogenase